MSLSETQEEEPFPIKRKLTLLDLPYDVIDIIFSKVDFRHQRYLRGVCKELRESHTRHIMHKYNWYVARFAYQKKQKDSTGDQRLKTLLQIMDGTARNFLQAGLESQYASNILYFYELNSIGSPSVIYDFLYRLQLGLEDPPLPGEDPTRMSVRDLRIIYTIALFRLLRVFENFRIVESDMNMMHWQLLVELPHVFLGVMDERKVNLRTSNRNKRIGFLSILAEMLYYVKRNQNYGGFKDTGNVVYTYGIQAGKLFKRKPRLMIKCMVLAPKTLLNLLQDVITGKDVTKKSFQVPVDATFRARLEVNNKPEKRFFDYGTMHINIFHDNETVN
ncbi:uncharacterized protein LOC110190258 isoform X1 [Drosophila serrata]|uniref:uncharacterized protein LOC110190258 isoform X1 n=2 Tax=Drosophila serrata TaxID=7274 RepID=UPI000A1D0D25|nr:uncharacterized protein LOC110190258 isoform X1 [Drosophila serrata]